MTQNFYRIRVWICGEKMEETQKFQFNKSEKQGDEETEKE